MPVINRLLRRGLHPMGSKRDDCCHDETCVPLVIGKFCYQAGHVDPGSGDWVAVDAYHRTKTLSSGVVLTASAVNSDITFTGPSAPTLTLTGPSGVTPRQVRFTSSAPLAALSAQLTNVDAAEGFRNATLGDPDSLPAPFVMTGGPGTEITTPTDDQSGAFAWGSPSSTAGPWDWWFRAGGSIGFDFGSVELVDPVVSHGVTIRHCDGRIEHVDSVTGVPVDLGMVVPCGDPDCCPIPAGDVCYRLEMGGPVHHGFFLFDPAGDTTVLYDRDTGAEITGATIVDCPCSGCVQDVTIVGPDPLPVVVTPPPNPMIDSTVERIQGVGVVVIAAGARTITVTTVAGSPTLSIGGGPNIGLTAGYSLNWGVQQGGLGGEKLADAFTVTGVLGSDVLIASTREI